MLLLHRILRINNSILIIQFQAVTSLCWQRSKPLNVNESNCSAEAALLGGAVEDSVLMPDPLPTLISSNPSVSTGIFGSLNTGSMSSLSSRSADVTPNKSILPPGKVLTKLQATRSRYSFKDDMEVFSPLVDVQPIAPSLDKLWDDNEGVKKDDSFTDKKLSSLLFPSSTRDFPFPKGRASDNPIFDWKSNSALRQVGTLIFSFGG